jgi:hypothetical protein
MVLVSLYNVMRTRTISSLFYRVFKMRKQGNFGTSTYDESFFHYSEGEYL